jgi:hypothetical protein
MIRCWLRTLIARIFAYAEGCAMEREPWRSMAGAPHHFEPMYPHQQHPTRFTWAEPEQDSVH